MPAFVTFGRILFAVLFIYTGATKLFAIQATADFIATKVVVPDVIAPYAKQVETATAMTTPQLLAIALGGLEIVAGLMIALNFGARFFAMLMIIYIAVSIFSKQFAISPFVNRRTSLHNRSVFPSRRRFQKA